VHQSKHTNDLAQGTTQLLLLLPSLLHATGEVVDTEPTTKKLTTMTLTGSELLKAISTKISDSNFANSNSNKAPPIAILALATVVAELVLHPNAPINLAMPLID
jgi:hypothetical protein